MLNAIKLLISYSSIRVLLYIVIVVLFMQFFIRVLLKKKIAIRAASITLLTVFVLATAILPVENLFLRHSTPTASVSYSFPNEGIVKIAEYRNWAAIQFKDDKTVYVGRDEKGWMTALPAISTDHEKKGQYHNISYMTKKLDTGIYYVWLQYTLPTDPGDNEEGIVIETLNDSKGSKFEEFGRDLFHNEKQIGREIYYFTFADIGDTGYKLIINGEEVTIN